MGDGDSAVSCPLCGADYFAAAPYAAHLAEAHGLVDEDGAETTLPPPAGGREPDPRVVAADAEGAPETEATAPEGPPRRGRGLSWRHSLGLVVKTVAVLVVLASAVAIVASLAKAGS